MRPRHDPPSRVPAGGSRPRKVTVRDLLARVQAGRRPRKRDDREPGGEPCPVEPNRPLDLSGGAAAALAFDD